MEKTVSLKSSAVAAALLLTATPLAAQSLSPFEDALLNVPSNAVAFERPYVEVEFGDPDASSNIADIRRAAGLPSPDPYVAHLGGLPTYLRQALVLVEPDDVIPTIGIAPYDLGASLHLSVPPNGLLSIALAPEARAAMRAALADSDSMTFERRGEAEVAWTGAQDFAVNIQNRDPSNPFGGNLGLSGRYLLTDPGVLWSPGWPAIEAALSDAEPFATDDRLAAIIDVLDATNAEAGSVLRHVYGVVADPAQLPAFAQTMLSNPSIAMTALMAFDLATQDTDIGFMVLTFSAGTDVTALAANVRTTLTDGMSLGARRPFNQIFEDAPIVTVHDGEVPALSIRSSAPASDDFLQNRPSHTLTNLLFIGDLGHVLTP